MESKAVENKFELSVIGSLGMILVYEFILSFFIIIPFSLILATSFSKNHETFEVVMKVLQELVLNIIIITLILKKIRRKSEKDFKLKYSNKFDLKLLFYTLLLMLGFYLWYGSSIGIVTEKIPMPQLMEEAFEELTKNSYIEFILVSITAPVFEEIIYRGIILQGFLNKYKPQTAILASALIFGLIHLNIPQFILATIVGLILGTLYYKTESLILCIAAHMVNNTIAIISGYITIPINMVSFFVGIVIFIISARFLMLHVKRFTGDSKRLKVDGTLDEVTT